jgi:hypothetical protein
MNMDIDCIFIKIDREDILEFGLAVDLFDAMVISDFTTEKLPISIIKEYQKMCMGDTFILKDSFSDLDIKDELKDSLIPISNHNLVNEILKIL